MTDDIIDQNHQKLLATPAAEYVAGPDGVGDGFGECFQGQVAGVVAVLVVDVFEVISLIY